MLKADVLVLLEDWMSGYWLEKCGKVEITTFYYFENIDKQ